MLDTKIAEALAQTPARDAATMTAERARAFLLDRVDNTVGDSLKCDVEEAAIPAHGGYIPVRVYRPTHLSKQPVPTVLFIHGGGWVAGDLVTHDKHARMLCTHIGAVVVSVDYRRPPEQRFPGAVEDCLAAMEWVAENQVALGGLDAPLGIAGDSAGGNLAAVVALSWKGSKRLAAQLLLYPATDLRSAYASNGPSEYASRWEHGGDGFLTIEMLRWYAQQYLGDPATGLDERASPLVSKNLHAAPAAVICIAEHDPLADEGRAFALALEDAGVKVVLQEVGGQTHGFFVMGNLSPAAEAAAYAAMDAFAALLVACQSHKDDHSSSKAQHRQGGE